MPLIFPQGNPHCPQITCSVKELPFPKCSLHCTRACLWTRRNTLLIWIKTTSIYCSVKKLKHRTNSVSMFSGTCGGNCVMYAATHWWEPVNSNDSYCLSHFKPFFKVTGFVKKELTYCNNPGEGASGCRALQKERAEQW